MRYRLCSGLRRLNLRSEKGQTFVLVAAAFPLVLAIAAVVIDGTRLFVAHQQIQNAADAASLAAGRELPASGCISPRPGNPAGTCPASVQSVASQYSQYNGGPVIDHACDPANAADTNCWLTPVPIRNNHGVVNDENIVQVRITEKRNGYFANAIGAGSLFHIRAVAAATPASFLAVTTLPGTVSPGTTTLVTSTSFQTSTTGGAPAILFAYGLYPDNFPAGNCVDSRIGGDSLQLNGSNNTFHGAVWSNGGVSPGPGTRDGAAAGDPNGEGFLFYVTPCTVQKPGNWLGTQTQEAKPIDWPVPLPVLTCAGGTVGTSCPAGDIATSVTDSTGHTVDCIEEVKSGTWQAPDNLEPGVYCSNQNINLGLNEQNVAFIAPGIGTTGSVSDTTYSGYTGLYDLDGGLFADGYGSGGVGGFASSAKNVAIKGAIFAPNGTAKIPGGGTTQACVGSNSCGFIEALAINFPSDGATYQGLGPPIGGTVSTTTIVSTSTFTLPGTTSPSTSSTTTVQQDPSLRQ